MRVCVCLFSKCLCERFVKGAFSFMKKRDTFATGPRRVDLKGTQILSSFYQYVSRICNVKWCNGYVSQPLKLVWNLACLLRSSKSFGNYYRKQKLRVICVFITESARYRSGTFITPAFLSPTIWPLVISTRFFLHSSLTPQTNAHSDILRSS